NNSRVSVSYEINWSFAGMPGISGQCGGKVATGEQAHIPLGFRLPAGQGPGHYELAATVRFSNSEVQRDTFAFDILPRPEPVRTIARIALFDTKGETRKLLDGLSI